MSTPASAATWTLEVPDTHPEPESKTMPDPNHGEESVIGDDYRELVFPVDFQDGGKYRCESPTIACARQLNPPFCFSHRQDPGEVHLT